MKTILTTILMLAAGVTWAQETPTNKTPDVTYAEKVFTNNVNVTIHGKPVIFTDYASKPTNQVWRFCHDGRDIKAMPYYSKSTTYTPWKIEECLTIEGVTNAIVKLHLALTPEQQDEMDKLVEQYGKDRDAKKTSGAVEITP